MTSFALEGVRWTARTVTWSFAQTTYALDAGLPFSSAITSPVYQAVVRQAFAEWGRITGLNFVESADAPTTGIRVGFGALPGNELGYTYFRQNGYALQPDVTVRLEDPSRRALNGPSLTYNGYTTTLAQVVLHEIGHAIGLAHSGDPNSIMNAVLGLNNPDLDTNDIETAQILYGLRDLDFDANYYLAHNPDVAAAGIDPLMHWVQWGSHEGRSPNALFNGTYYLNQNPDVAAAGMDPLYHHQTWGWREGRNPSISFDTKAYLAANPDVAAQNVDPLWFQLNSGLAQGRMSFIATPNAVGPQDPLVINAYYWGQNPDVAAAGMNPTTHYDQYGWKEGRNPDPLFDTRFYGAHNPDVVAAGFDPLFHYETWGWHEGRDPSAAFSTSKYLAANPDVKAAGMDPLQHYLQYGMAEGRAIYASST